jgi:hypothetical protein
MHTYTNGSTRFDNYGWPINPRGVGCSDQTAIKQQEFAAIVRLNVALVHNINVGRQLRGQKPYPYVGLDPTSGPGGYIWQPPLGPLQTIIGTSLRSALTCHEGDLQGGYRLGFIEREQAWVTCLKERLEEMARAGKVDLERIEVSHGRYQDLAVDWVLRNVPRHGARGLIAPDPNGEFSFDTLKALGELPHLKCVDFALHVSAAVLKWRHNQGAVPLPDAMAACRKDNWFVGPVTKNWQWAWLFGCNWDRYPELRQIGLVSWTSPEGQDRLVRLCETHEQTLRRLQPSFDLDQAAD